MDNIVDHVKYAYESGQIRLERTIKRLWILCIILIIALIATNAGWLYYESQWNIIEDSTEVSQELNASNGNATINDGVYINVKDKTDSKN